VKLCGIGYVHQRFENLGLFDVKQKITQTAGSTYVAFVNPIHAYDEKGYRIEEEFSVK
jgi:hypothetical protein